ncbi:hypothetical protein BCR32DRAFT_291633, partial [Anaeromyces robustus]
MLSNKNKNQILDDSFNNNLKSYLRNVQLNNPDKEINLDFLKNYLQKIEDELDKKSTYNLKKVDEKDISSINYLEESRINYLKKERNKTENIQNDNIDKENEFRIPETRKTKRNENLFIKSHKRRKSSKFIVRESDAFMKGTWDIEEGIEDNLNIQENENSIDVIGDNSNINDNNDDNDKDNDDDNNDDDNNNYKIKNKEKKYKDLKIDDVHNIQNTNIGKIINEIKVNEKSEQNTNFENDIKKGKEPEKKKGFFSKFFDMLKISSRKNKKDSDTDSNIATKNKELKGILSSSSASSISDSSDESNTSKKSINTEESEKNDDNKESIDNFLSDVTPTVTIDNDTKNIDSNDSKKQYSNVTLLNQIDDGNNNNNDDDDDDDDYNDNFFKKNYSRANRSHSLYITEKEKLDYLLNIEFQRKRKRENRLNNTVIEIYQKPNELYKRSKTELDKYDFKSDQFNDIYSTNNNNKIVNENQIDSYNNYNNNNSKNDFDFDYNNNNYDNNDKYNNYNDNDNDNNNDNDDYNNNNNNNNNDDDDDDDDNYNNNNNNNFENINNKKIKIFNKPFDNTCSSYNSSEAELNDSKFIRLIKGENNNNINIENDFSGSNIPKNKSKHFKTNEKLSILPNDYDFSKIDENFDNIFDISEEKIIPVNLMPFSSMFTESIIYPASDNTMKLDSFENVLNSTMVKNKIQTNENNINYNKNDSASSAEENKSTVIIEDQLMDNNGMETINNQNNKINSYHDDIDKINDDDDLNNEIMNDVRQYISVINPDEILKYFDFPESEQENELGYKEIFQNNEYNINNNKVDVTININNYFNNNKENNIEKEMDKNDYTKKKMKNEEDYINEDNYIKKEMDDEDDYIKEEIEEDDYIKKEMDDENNYIVKEIDNENDIKEKMNQDMDNSDDNTKEETDDENDEIPIYKSRKNRIKSIIISDEEDIISSEDEKYSNPDIINKNVKQIDSSWHRRQKLYLMEEDDDDDNDEPIRYSDKNNKKCKLNTIKRNKNMKKEISIKERREKDPIKNFKKERFNITPILYKEFNEVIFKNKLPVDLTIEWSKTLYKTAGRILNNKNKQNVRTIKIELSCKVLDKLEKLRNTLVHEMCHVAVILIDGIDGEKHGSHFKYWGKIAESHYSDIKVTTYHSYTINYKYKYQCQNCGYIYGRHSNSIDVNKYRCKCKGELKLMNKIKKDGTPYKERTPGKFANFVKENFSKIQKENPKLPHKDIMSLL